MSATGGAYESSLVVHVDCPPGCQIPWAVCPWCRVAGVPHVAMRECRSWYKADREHDCAQCGCDHKGKPEPHYYDTFMHHELCKSGCVEWVKPLSPCETWLKEHAA